MDKEAPQERVEAVLEGSWKAVELGRGGPTEEELKTAQRTEFGDMREYVNGKSGYLVDDVAILRSTRREELPSVISKTTVREVLRFVHGTRTTGHYRVQRTMAKLVRRFRWKGMGRDAATYI